MSAEEPTVKFQPSSHRIDEARGGSGNWQLVCWYCGARGRLPLSARKALGRWQHLADRDGAPAWW